MWLQTLKTRFEAPEIPRNMPMIIWNAFVPRFFAKSRMLMITTHAYTVLLSLEARSQLSKHSTNFALVSLLAAGCCFCCSDRFGEVIIM